MGGNRSILVDHHLSGVIAGLTLASTPEDVYLALVESTAYGTRVIVEAFEAAGLPVSEFIVAGGLNRTRPPQAPPAADPDLRGRAAPPGLRGYLGTGAGRRVGDPRRGRRRAA